LLSAKPVYLGFDGLGRGLTRGLERADRQRGVALVKSLVQLNGWVGGLPPVESQKGLIVKVQGVFEGLVGEVILAVQVDMPPAHGRTGGDGIGWGGLIRNG